MSNIIKGFYIAIFAFFISSQANCQAIIGNGTNLDVNGEVYSVKEIPFFGGYYVVVGNFTNAGGIAVNNIAFLNKTTLQFEPVNIVSSIDGAITDVGFGTFTIVNPNAFILYVSGTFNNINGQPRNGMASFFVSEGNASQLNGFTLNSWDPGLDLEVRDIEQRNDTLFFAGRFGYVNNGVGPNDFRPGIAAINSEYGTVLDIFDTSNPCVQGGQGDNKIILGKSHIYEAGYTDESFYRRTYGGCKDNSMPGQGAITFVGGAGTFNFGGKDIAIVRDSVIAGIYLPDIGQLEVLTYNQGAEYPVPTSANIVYKTVASYKERFYFGRELTGGFITGTISAVGPSGQEWVSIGMFESFPDYLQEHLFVQNNILFGSIPGTYSVGFSGTRTGLFAYCLDPEDAKDFTVFDTTICQGDTVTYTIPAAEYADGYEWDFSGTGTHVNYQVLPIANSGETAGPSVDIIFFENFTPGSLTCTPYSTCGGLTDGGARVYSEPVSINIGTNPLPNASAGSDTLINCYEPIVDLIGFSDTASITYSWKEAADPSFTLINPFTVTDSGQYVLKVTRPNGCAMFDTVSVVMDTISPTFDPVTPGILGCGDSIYLLGHCNNLTDTLSWWQKTGTSDTLGNPGVATTIGNYDFYTINLTNGCKDSLNPNIYVDQNSDPPNIELTGYASIPLLGNSLETITCATPTFNIQAYSDTANTSVDFVDINLLNPQGNAITVDTAGTFYLLATNNNNNCTHTTQILFDIDKTLPTITIDATSNLNCSNDSLLLNGSTISLDTNLVWTATSISPSANPVWINTQDTYTLTITKNSNGCSAIDSVTIIQDNSIDIMTSSDTVVCETYPADLSASYVGTISGINYNWNNGNTTSSSTYIGGTDQYGIIEITGDAGCYGIDTIFIDTPPQPVISFQGFQPCGTGSTGSIVATPISGWAPFEYSLDGGITFQTSTTLGGLDLGNYVVTVKDTLACNYDFPVTISVTSALASPDFIFSTYNAQWDTVIVIDVSNPSPDSVFWTFSPEITYIGEDNGSPLIILPDTGVFSVTMDAYYGTCLSSETKLIYADLLDTADANLYNSNGIKSVDLYPNPTNGTFTIDVEFYKEQNVTISVNDMSGLVYNYLEFQDTDSISESITIDASAINGTYVLRVASEFDSAFISFILNR